MTENTRGILLYRNLKAFDPKKPPEYIVEYILYTDAHILGELKNDCEPYAFLNMVPVNRAPGVVCESVALQISWYLTHQNRYEIRTDTSMYHGGSTIDEIAALASLKLGIRMKAGCVRRTFDLGDQDPLGRPIAPVFPAPQLITRSNRLILPSVVKEANLTELSILKKLRHIDEGKYVALIRSARLYQDALWVAESEPALAWLMLVSAIEVAANEWAVGVLSPAEKIKTDKPELAELLLAKGGEDLLTQVANHIAPSLGATKKFIDFCLMFMPLPPENRPIKWAQVEWDQKHLKKILSKIYSYRSNALHGGTPFPEPMCRAPECLSDEWGVAEIGTTALATHTLGASWESKDLPINMNTFNYIVNGVLNRWWASFEAK